MRCYKNFTLDWRALYYCYCNCGFWLERGVALFSIELSYFNFTFRLLWSRWGWIRGGRLPRFSTSYYWLNSDNDHPNIWGNNWRTFHHEGIATLIALCLLTSKNSMRQEAANYHQIKQIETLKEQVKLAQEKLSSFQAQFQANKQA